MYKANQTNQLLYKHISEKYNSISKFAEIAGVSQEELSVILLKDNIIRWMAIGLKIFRSLNIDAEKFILDGEIAETDISMDAHEHLAYDELLDYYIRLSEAEKATVKEFIGGMLGKGEQGFFTSQAQNI